VKPPRRDTRALSPADMFGGKAPPPLTAQKADRIGHQGLCAIRLVFFFFANGEYKQDNSWGAAQNSRFSVGYACGATR
jgi:hypothetical protein